MNTNVTFTRPLCALVAVSVAISLGACAPVQETPNNPNVRRDASTDRPNPVINRDSGVVRMDVPTGGGGDTGAGCGAGSAICSGTCRNLQTDETNCGSCGHRCGGAEACESGMCTGGGGPCDAPRMMCGASCVDTSTDSANCGGCGQACAAGEGCTAGMCGMGGGGPGMTGAMCMMDSDCGMNAVGPGFCLLAFPGGSCSFDCMTDADCGGGAACIDPDGMGPLCLQTCDMGTPCRAGLQCYMAPPPSMGGFCAPGM